MRLTMAVRANALSAAGGDESAENTPARLVFESRFDQSEPMLRLLLATMAALLVAVASAAAAGTPLEGTFQTTVTHAPKSQLDGHWQVALLPGGGYTIERNGVVLVLGLDAETATTITFDHESGLAACTGTSARATYKWSLKARVLRLTPVRDSCLGRHVVLTTHPLKETD